MRIWLIQLGEPLPIDEAVRLYRTGILAQMLVDKGHDVTWWTTTFFHTHKRQRMYKDTWIDVNPAYRIRLLYAKGYQKNISLARLIFQKKVALKFKQEIWSQKSPDIILTSLPTPELSLIAIEYGLEHEVPVFVDVRDIWPDIYFSIFPESLGLIAKRLLNTLVKRNQYIFSNATGIIGISNSYLEWGLKYAGREISVSDKVFPLGYQKLNISEDELNKAFSELFELGIEENKVTICFFGVFGNTYDLITVIKAADILSSSSNIQFVICGDGEKREDIQKNSQKLKNFFLPGWINPAKIVALLEISEIGLAPYSESAPQSLPNKPFEYFSGGLLVVSSLKGELATLLEKHNCGITYEPNNHNQLAEKILMLSQNEKLRRKMKKNAIKLYEQKFDSTIIYSKMIKFLEASAKKYQSDCIDTRSHHVKA